MSRRLRVLLLASLLGPAPAGWPQFLDEFDGPALAADPTAQGGWAWHSGDGVAVINFSQADGAGRIEVDATADARNIWWTIIRRAVTPAIDLEELIRPDRELRVEARIRSDTAPRRVNLHFNHSHTTDFHSHLMEHDIPVAGEWRDISMTTHGFDARPGDAVFVQMALMDWGSDRYTVDVDRIEVRVVDPAQAGRDLGEPLPFHPAPLPLDSFGHHLAPEAGAVVDPAWPDVNFLSWGLADEKLLAVGASRISLMRWDLSGFEGGEPAGWGLLVLIAAQVERAETGLKDFGMLRVVEILGGDAEWSAGNVTWASFTQGLAREDVLNPQLLRDIVPVAGDSTLIPVSPPVLRRLLSGRSKGLALQAQGAISASFHSTGSDAGPMLYFNLEQSH